MILVSQNKKNIYNFNNVKSIDIVGDEIYISDDILSDMGTCIANYETEERAKEVLKEIAEYYSKFYEVQGEWAVYQMPKE